jgi:hypothetical protein
MHLATAARYQTAKQHFSGIEFGCQREAPRCQENSTLGARPSPAPARGKSWDE